MQSKTFLYLLFLLFLLSSGVIFAGDKVQIPASEFTMGGSGGEADELPGHLIQTRSFSIDKYEVSRKEYDACVKSGRCTPPHYGDGKCYIWTSKGPRRVRVPNRFQDANYPVVCVTWYQARDYCRVRGERLPTEAEWEKAALSGTSNRYSWGNSEPSSSNYKKISNGSPAVVGSYKPNGFGLYDMTGNVWEWVNDRYEKDYYAHSEKISPKGPSVGRFRTLRGGGWYSSKSQLRIKNRQWFVGEGGEVSVGFRCVK